MASIRTIELDSGNLIVNADYKEILEANGLNTFEAVMNYTGGTVVKRALRERYTTRIAIRGRDGEINFFLKRYFRPPIKEYFKQLIRFTKPVIGAKNEWDALMLFHYYGIPSAVPVAFGKKGSRSLTLTLAIEGCIRASDWLERFRQDTQYSMLKAQRRLLVMEIGRIVKKLHTAGLNHQDLYLCHFLVRFQNDRPHVFLIDPQRVMVHSGQLPARWKIKDLAQLCFSATSMDDSELRLLFEIYGVSGERGLMKKIGRKVKQIAKHDSKK